MSKALARAELMKSLEPRMAARGFRLVKSMEWYQQKQPGIKRLYELEFINCGDYNSVRPGIRMRIDEVEKIFHRTSGYEKSAHSSTSTLGRPLWKLTEDHKQFQYDLGDVDHVPVVASLAESAFDTMAAPLFEKYSTVAAVDSVLNKDPYKFGIFHFLPYMQYAHGVIAARLNQRPDYGKLVDIYSKAMKRIAKGFYSDRFEALVRDLEDDDLIEQSRRKLQAQGLLGA